MINIYINGQKSRIKKDTTARQLLDERKISSGAVWVNGTQLLKKEYGITTFSEGDVIKILRLVSGG